MLFLGIISWKGASCFNGEFVFQMGGSFIFKWGVHPMEGALVLIGGVSKNIVGWGGCPPCPPPPPPPTMGNPAYFRRLSPCKYLDHVQFLAFQTYAQNTQKKSLRKIIPVDQNKAKSERLFSTVYPETVHNIS